MSRDRKKRGSPAGSVMELSVAHFAQLDRVVVPLRDLVVLVGPQATGKSLVLEMLKLAVDRNRIVRTLKQHGINWTTNEEFAALYFGAGLEKAWNDETAVVYDSTPIGLADVANARGYKGEDAVFYIPAHRTLAIADGWPRSFAAYQIETPFVARRFSEQLLTSLNLGLVGKGSFRRLARRSEAMARRAKREPRLPSAKALCHHFDRSVVARCARAGLDTVEADHRDTVFGGANVAAA
ncbi:MAG: hypothetical protein HY898_31505 [Deltaproteobacteria bacterium]|nr:hypothetical protein [Deltaproteobacteria bacterium]